MNPIRKNILFIHPSNELYGADRSLLRLVSSLDKKKYNPVIVLPNDVNYDGLLSNELEKLNIKYYIIKLAVLRRKYFTFPGLVLFLYRLFTSIIFLCMIIKKESISVIHSNSTAVISGAFVKLFFKNIPHIWHVREIITTPKWLNKLIANTLYKFSSTIIAVSEATKNNLVAAQKKIEEKIIVIHNGIDFSFFETVNNLEINSIKKNWNINNEILVVGMIGRINLWKGQSFLVDAMLPILKKRKNVKLVLLGGIVPGKDQIRDNLLEKISRNLLNDQIIIEDFKKDIRSYLQIFDIFILPSIKPDPFPTVILEAMALGKPVIATNHGGAVEQVENGRSGFLISPLNVDELTQKIDLLIISENLRTKMGNVGKAKVVESFTIHNYVSRVEKLYESLLNINY